MLAARQAGTGAGGLRVMAAGLPVATPGPGVVPCEAAADAFLLFFYLHLSVGLCPFVRWASGRSPGSVTLPVPRCFVGVCCAGAVPISGGPALVRRLFKKPHLLPFNWSVAAWRPWMPPQPPSPGRRLFVRGGGCLSPCQRAVASSQWRRNVLLMFSALFFCGLVPALWLPGPRPRFRRAQGGQ